MKSYVKNLSKIAALFFVSVMLLFSTFFSQTLASFQETQKHIDYVPGEIIVKLKEQHISAFSQKPFERGKLLGVRKFKIPQGADIEKWARAYENDPNVEYAEPNYISRIVSTYPNDPQFQNGTQWALNQITDSDIDAPEAWDMERGNGRVVVAVVDTGIDWNHPDLEANIWTNPGEIPSNGVDDDQNGFIDDVIGWDFVDTENLVWPGEDGAKEDNNPMDFHGHGTMVAGVVGAVTNNSTGIAGVSWYSKIMPLRAGYAGIDGYAYLEASDAAEAIIYAASNGASVINMSWGGPSTSRLIKDALDYASSRDIVLVGAAGNDDSSTQMYLGTYDSVIAVTATDQYDRKAYFSNYGPWVDVSAPGVNIFTTCYNNTYTLGDGTSMATPFVSGLAALLISEHPDWTNDQITQRIISTADNIDDLNPDYIGQLGGGRINAGRCLINWISRLSGVSRYETSQKISQEMYPQGVNAVVLARSDDFSDALAGVTIASQKNSPILLTKSNVLVPEARDEIIRLDPDKIYILGGEKAINSSVEEAISTLGFDTERIAGNNRYETAVKIAGYIYNYSVVSSVFVTSGENFPDALTSAVPAHKNTSPLVLTKKDYLPEAISTYLGELTNLNTIYVIGGEDTISQEVLRKLRRLASSVIRISGEDRYETATKVAENFFSNPSRLIISRGDEFPDALSGGALAIKKDAPILLTYPQSLSEKTSRYIKEEFIYTKDQSEIYLLGGKSAISENVKLEVEKEIF